MPLPLVTVTKGAPLPSLLTVSVKPLAKVAVTVRFAVIVTLQAPAPVQLPPQPMNFWFGPGLGVSATICPLGKVPLQPSGSPGQAMPIGVLLTVEVLLPPVTLTFSVNAVAMVN